METLVILMVLVVLGGLGLMIWLTTQSQRAQREELASLRGELDQRLSEGQQQVRSQLQQVTDLFGQVREGMGQLYEAAAKMAELGKSIGGLEQLLRAPKVRGSLGEQRLEQLLKDILPAETFALQHHFRDGQSVDAIIRLGGHIVPIDAKFPLDNYAQLVEAASDQERNAARRSFLRAVKGHIDKVTQYIRPNEETYDFAIVYLPAESIYYEAFVRESRGDEDLTSYAHNRHVFPV
ncbi:MAG: DNA recombination protein RmuC, partial [Chloroflexi bacterium]|nr:DNA recombination protein RmuC [Chloroflexota bacterium]